MRVLGLDYGRKRIGMALSDPMGWTAQGLGVLVCRDARADLERIGSLVARHGVGRIVVGLPRNMDGSLGPMAREVRSFVEALAGVLEVPVETVDERLTTVEAERAMIRGGLSRRKRRERVDRIAAQLILQIYLDRSRNLSPGGPS